MSDTLTFSQLHSVDPSADALLARHHALMRATSPAESCHVMTAAELRASGARVFCGRDASDEVLAIGAFVLLSETAAELKSMHCHDKLRGRGAGKALLAHLTAEARKSGIRSLWLETGTADLFVPARALYKSVGFVECAPFGTYVTDPLSTYMTRTI